MYFELSSFVYSKEIRNSLDVKFNQNIMAEKEIISGLLYPLLSALGCRDKFLSNMAVVGRERVKLLLQI
jgi:hypothetical protein